MSALSEVVIRRNQLLELSKTGNGYGPAIELYDRIIDDMAELYGIDRACLDTEEALDVLADRGLADPPNMEQYEV